MAQNIYDNPEFFRQYKALRENPLSFNDLLERPTLFSMLPDLRGLRVLDLGCGMGDNCRLFADMGAAAVVGLDVSENMLREAREATTPPQISYICRDLAALDAYQPAGPFDLVVSSLCFHYLEDYQKLLRDIHRLLVPGGLLVFSQEHPVVTAPSLEDLWTLDENGEILYGRIREYNMPGPRLINWFVEGVEIHHRTMAQLINGLVAAGFTLEQVEESCPSPEAIAKSPRLAKELHRPCFVFFRGRK